MLMLLLACGHAPVPETYDPARDIPVESDPSGSTSDVEQIPSATAACDPADIDPYDPSRAIAYELDADADTLAMLDALGYAWWSSGETYDQIDIFASSVTVNVPGCEEIVFEEPRVDTGRQMGWQSPYAEASWIVEYDERHGDQELGGYDDARYWSPTYDGPVIVPWIYESSMDYLSIPHRYAVWMRFRTSWWGDQEAIYNALEPYEDDFAERNGFHALWEGYDLAYHPGEGAACKAGDCDAAAERMDECLERLYALTDPEALLVETGDCFDWTELAAVTAWQDWFSHWDGCGSNNCYGYFAGDPSDPSTWKAGELVSGVDLLLGTWTPVDSVDLSWMGGTPAWYCKADTSPDGCLETYLSDLASLSERSRSGQMEADLRETFALRQTVGVALDGDEAWVERAVEWVTLRPDYVDAAVDAWLYPCGHDTSGDTFDTSGVVPPPGGGWDTGGYVDPCGRDTGSGGLDTAAAAVDTGPFDTGR